MAQKLADLIVQISAKGLGAVRASLAGVHEGLNKIKQVSNEVAAVAGRAFNFMSAAALGFVAAGLQGTKEGEALKISMQGLGREIAGVALPAVEKITGWVKQLTGWFSQLTMAQQDNVLKWSLVGLGVLGVTKLLPALIVVAKVALGVMTAMVAHPIVSGFAALAAAIGALAFGFDSLSRKADKAREEIKKFQRGEIDNLEENPMFKRIFPEGQAAALANPEARAAGIKRAGEEFKRLEAEMAQVNQRGALNLADMMGGDVLGMLMKGDKTLGRVAEIKKQMALHAKLADALVHGKPFEPVEGGGHRMPELASKFKGSTGGIESILESVSRIATSAIRVQSAQEDVPKQQLEEIKGLRRDVQRLNPAVGA